jgi:hypothetical protein
MPRQTSKSGLASKLGKAGRDGFDGHKEDETTLSSGGDLPAGIEGGIAQLVECKFGNYQTGDNIGEYFFTSSGIVLEPKDHDGVDVAGRRTRIGPEPLCEITKGNRKRKTVDEQLSWILNELRKLGLDTTDLGIDDLEDAVATLEEAAPYFRFRTWKGSKQTTGQYKDQEPRVMHDWRGHCEYEGEVFVGVVDNTADDHPTTNTITVGYSKEDNELVELGINADKNEDDSAKDRLTELAVEAGISSDTVDSADSWTELVDLIKSANIIEDTDSATISDASKETVDTIKLKFRDKGLIVDSEEDQEGQYQDELEEAAEASGLDHNDYDSWVELGVVLDSGGGQEAIPKEGEVWDYKPPKARKFVECDVKKVFPRKKTCNLKNLSDGTIYKGVEWSKLQSK